MSTRDILIRNLAFRFDAYAELVATVDGDALRERLGPPKHKSLGEHLWCVIGARESYARALEAGEWPGFACSMKSFGHADFTEKLASSARMVLDCARRIDQWTDARDELLLMLTEHEVMHEGQIIRHMYGLERTLPASWRWA
jgi:hypothetical protein